MKRVLPILKVAGITFVLFGFLTFMLYKVSDEVHHYGALEVALGVLLYSLFAGLTVVQNRKALRQRGGQNPPH